MPLYGHGAGGHRARGVLIASVVGVDQDAALRRPIGQEAAHRLL